jgi:hypothetical protein
LLETQLRLPATTGLGSSLGLQLGGCHYQFIATALRTPPTVVSASISSGNQLDPSCCSLPHGLAHGGRVTFSTWIQTPQRRSPPERLFRIQQGPLAQYLRWRPFLASLSDNSPHSTPARNSDKASGLLRTNKGAGGIDLAAIDGSGSTFQPKWPRR